MRLRLVIFGLSVFILASCQKRIEDQTQVDDMRLSVSPSFFGDDDGLNNSAPSARPSSAPQAGVDTKVQEPSFTKSSWSTGDQFSMFLTVQSDGQTTPISFVGNVYNKMRYDNLVYTYNGTEFSTASVQYYPFRRSLVDLFGIYPYDAEFGRDAAANVGGSKRDKSNPSGYLWSVFDRQDLHGSFTGGGNRTSTPKFNIEQSDLLSAHSAGVVPNSDGLAQPLVFKHVMSKVYVRLLVPSEFDGLELDELAPITSAKLLNTHLDGLVDFRADTVYVQPSESVTPITMRAAGSLVPKADAGVVDGTYYYFESVVIPQSVEAGKNFFQVQVKYKNGSSSAFIMRIGNIAQRLYSGKEHFLDILFDSKIGLRLNGSDIKDWVEGYGGGGVVGPNDASAAANSFVVSVGDELLLNAKLAGNDVAGTSTYSQNLRSKVKSVRLLWQTKSGHTTNGPLLISSIDDTKLDLVRIKTNAAATGGGNAVVAAYSAIGGTGDILWSWHIWVNPVKLGLDTYGDKFVAANGVGNAIMDRNLGSLSGTASDGSSKTGGLLYQWGRKDPFTGTNTGTTTTAVEVYDMDGAVKVASLGSVIAGDGSFKYLSSNVDNIDGGIKNPMTLYYAGDDWTNPSVAGLWANYPTDKAIFDPCPAGYRVAAGDSWTDLGTVVGNYGVVDGSGATMHRLHNELGGGPSFPFAGSRNNASGSLAGVASSYALHTASSYSDLSKGYLYLGNVAQVWPKGEAVKHNAASVRCVMDNIKADHLSIVAPRSVPSGGGSVGIKVYTGIGAGWKASVSGGVGFSVAPATGSGNGVVNLTATSAGAVGRTATVTVQDAFGTIVRTAKIVQVPSSVVVGGAEWSSFNLTGDDGQGAIVGLADEPQAYGKFFKWGDAWVYQRATSTTDGDWTTNTSGAATVPAVSYTGGLGNDYLFGLSGGRAGGDPCQNVGSAKEWHTPTHSQWAALYGTGSKWGTYQGVNGTFMGAKAQTCDNDIIQDGCIFIPASGYRDWNNGMQRNQGDQGSYWSSSVNNNERGWYCYFNSGGVHPDNATQRGYGVSVRCVRLTGGQLALSATAPGESVTAAGKDYTVAVGAYGAWTTESPVGITVTPSSGTGANTAVTISVAANSGAERAVSVIFRSNNTTPHQSTTTWSGTQASAGPPTVEIAGTKWTLANLTGDASSNTGHKVEANPQDKGMFYKWGATYNYKRATDANEGEGFASDRYTRGASTNGTVTANVGYDYVNLTGSTYSGDPCQKLDGSYKTPTRTQWKALHASGKSGWTTYQGMQGYFFGPKAAQCNNTTIQEGCIFLPASGRRYYGSGSLVNEGSYGWYWSSSVSNANDGYYLYFDLNGSINPEIADVRSSGFSVRCVQE